MENRNIKKLWYTNQRRFIDNFSVLQTIHADGFVEHTYYEYISKTHRLKMIPTCQIIEVNCTGVYDATKWKDLTPEEKEKFFAQIKEDIDIDENYKKIDDVKDLWKGKLIFEGDVVEIKVSKDKHFYGIVQYDDMDGCWSKGFSVLGSYKDITKVIGNIFENPELRKTKPLQSIG